MRIFNTNLNSFYTNTMSNERSEKINLLFVFWEQLKKNIFIDAWSGFLDPILDSIDPVSFIVNFFLFSNLFRRKKYNFMNRENDGASRTPMKAKEKLAKK